MLRNSLNGGRPKLTPATLTVIFFLSLHWCLFSFYFIFKSFKMIPLLANLGQILSCGILAVSGLFLLKTIWLVLRRFKAALFSRNITSSQRGNEVFTLLSFSVILGLLGFFLFATVSLTVFFSNISEEKLINKLDYSNFGKTIYIYAEKRCFFDCHLYYSFWLQNGWLPVTHQLAEFQDSYDYAVLSPTGHTIPENQIKEKAIYQKYLDKNLKEKDGKIQIFFDSRRGKGFWYYDLKTGKSREELIREK